ncbi:uncharacterized protein LOC111409335 isoform X1 [Olea europaea var. sylvestris]|uniref:uncharacterized protein LOC111409335 isoform X1 n=1 Tax=Olea europaea var. sylvestris TaxID=158386 RepID=UPI000C1CFAE8|nr:uncharacterized protein LOC111409335 isoform X1 [Olea europaea var. sylvestris]
MEVSSTENSNVTTNWLCDYELMDGISTVSAAADFPSLTTPPPSTATIGFSWPAKAISCISIVSSELDCSFEDAEGFKEVGPRKRYKSSHYFPLLLVSWQFVIHRFLCHRFLSAYLNI